MIKLRNLVNVNGIGSNYLKCQHFENKFYKYIFPSSVKKSLENIENELSSLVFTYFDNNHTKDSTISAYNRKISDKTKQMINRYEACNILMSKKFRKFITKTKKLEFYNPKSASNSISIIQRYLNNKIKINSNLKQKDNSQRGSSKLNNDSLMHFKTEHKSNIIRNLINKNQSLCNIINGKEKIKNQKLFFNRKKMSYKQPKTKRKNNSQIILPHSLSFNSIKGRNNKKIKYKLRQFDNGLENDFERKYLDKSLMTKSYLRNYSYYDKLSDKELKFQKDFLYYKFNNSLYRVKNSIEAEDGIIGKNSLENFSLIIGERAKEKAKLKAKENLLDINLIKDSFARKENKFTLKMKYAMFSVINKYISQKKSKSGKTNLINRDGIQKNNRKKILYLDNTVYNINDNISKIGELIQKIK